WSGRADLLISTVPVVLPTDLASALVKLASTVFDVVYDNYPSPLDRAAHEAGVTLLDGLDLLVGQAIDQIRLMTGRDADPAPLLAACRAEVLRRMSGKES
ncbi:MAG: shikimate dehydrogenase, partial [Brooklawnia sp.]